MSQSSFDLSNLVFLFCFVRMINRHASSIFFKIYNSVNVDPRALERRALGNPETKCLLIGFHEDQSKASLIGAFMLARGVSKRHKFQINDKLLILRWDIASCNCKEMSNVSLTDVH